MVMRCSLLHLLLGGKKPSERWAPHSQHKGLREKAQRGAGDRRRGGGIRSVWFSTEAIASHSSHYCDVLSPNSILSAFLRTERLRYSLIFSEDQLSVIPYGFSAPSYLQLHVALRTLLLAPGLSVNGQLLCRLCCIKNNLKILSMHI